MRNALNQGSTCVNRIVEGRLAIAVHLSIVARSQVPTKRWPLVIDKIPNKTNLYNRFTYCEANKLVRLKPTIVGQC